MMIARTAWFGIGVVAVLSTGCARGPQIETRTFRIQHLPPGTVEQLIAPYVFLDREGAPGAFEVAGLAVTVRETRDNLERIARMLEEYDRPSRRIALQFQIIVANGATESDEAIAEVEQELRRLFRFEGYSLAAEATVAGHEHSEVFQDVFDQRLGPNDDRPTITRPFTRYSISCRIGRIRETTEGRSVDLAIQLHGNDTGIMETSVSIPVGNTAVLGTTQLPGNQALILTVQATQP